MATSTGSKIKKCSNTNAASKCFNRIEIFFKCKMFQIYSFFFYGSSSEINTLLLYCFCLYKSVKQKGYLSLNGSLHGCALIGAFGHQVAIATASAFIYHLLKLSRPR